MDATVRGSSSRVHALSALTVFACVFSLFVLMDNAGTQTILIYTRRDVGETPQNGSVPGTVTSSSVTSSAISLSLTRSSATSSTSTTSSSAISTTSSTSIPLHGSTTISSTLSQVGPSPSTSSSNATSSSSATSISTSTPTQSSSSTQLSTSVSTSRTSFTTTRPYSSAETPFNTQPATTLSIASDFLPTTSPTSSLAVSSLSPEITNIPTPVSAAASSSGFWKKKSAVAAVFVIVSLVSLAAAAFVVIAFLKSRSKRREDRLHEELFENYSEHDHRSNSPGPSINAAPLNPFGSAETGLSQVNSFHRVHEAHTVRSITPVQHPDYYSSEKSPTVPSRYMHPSQSQNSQSMAPPTAFRHLLGHATTARISQPISIDSFYGAAGQLPSTGYAH